MSDRMKKTVTYELPKGYNYSEHDIDEGYYKCPNCEKFAAFMDRHKIGECLHCDKNLQFIEKSTMFVSEYQRKEVDES